MYIFEMGRKARLVQQCSSGGSRISSITQRDFYIGLLYIFLLAELVGRRILEIIFCIFSIQGGGGAISWTLMGPHNKLFLPAVKKKYSIFNFAEVVSWRRNSECITVESGISHGAR